MTKRNEILRVITDLEYIANNMVNQPAVRDAILRNVDTLRLAIKE